MGYMNQLAADYQAVRGRLWTLPKTVRQSRMMRTYLASRADRARALLDAKYDGRLPFLTVLYPGPQAEITLAEIADAVAARHGVTLAQLRGSRRFQELCDARWEFFYLARLYTNRSFPRIGRFLRKGHTSVMHGIRKHCERNGLAFPRRDG